VSTFCILASGPSLSKKDVAVVRVAREQGLCKAIVVNDTFRLAPWADILYAADIMWWKHPHNADAQTFQGEKHTIVSPALGAPLPDPIYPGMRQWINGGSVGFDNHKNHIRTCMNSGYQALHIAAHLGATRVLLLGFDMRPVNGKAHWFGDHPAGLNKTSPYEGFIRHISKSAHHYADKGIRVVNCTPQSALQCFEFGTLEKELGTQRVLPASAACPALSA